MAIEPAIMQIISKNTDYSKEKITIKTFETSIKDIIRKIKGQAGDTLALVQTGDYISDSLLADIKAGQVAYEPRFEALITDITDYTATDPRADLSPYTAYVYLYSAVTAGIIEADDNIIYQILSEIMNNEGYFWERRVSIRDILWYIRNIIVATGIWGQYEVNLDNYAAFVAITKPNLILQDIIDVMEGGEESMQLKQQTISITPGTHLVNADEAEITLEMATDEILYSIDSLSINIDNDDALDVANVELYVYEEKVDVTNVSYRGTLQSETGISIGTSSNVTRIYSGDNISTAVARSLKSTIVFQIKQITSNTNDTEINVGTLKFTVRKVAVYT